MGKFVRANDAPSRFPVGTVVYLKIAAWAVAANIKSPYVSDFCLISLLHHDACASICRPGKDTLLDAVLLHLLITQLFKDIILLSRALIVRHT